ncbi:MAG: hypothetical protein RL538_744 [Candidatus Parcubacteria bacterium]|jgi:hypothetical protein
MNMKLRYHLLFVGSAFGLGVGAIPAYQHLYPEVVPAPVFTETEKPTLVSAQEIAAIVKADAFLVSSRGETVAEVTVRSGSDISNDAPTDGLWGWLREWWKRHTTRDRLTAHVSGEVLAGFDLRGVSAKNVVSSTNNEVVFNLGTPEFLGVLNNEMATKVVKRETGWFRVKDETLLLASQALGEPELLAAACRKGALQTAGESGTEIMSRINNLMRSRGDTRRVRVIFTPGRC